MAKRDNYTFENQSAIPAPFDEILPAYFRSWDDPETKDDYYLNTFAPDAVLIFGPKPTRSREAIRAFRGAMVHHLNGPVVDLEHTLGKCFVLAGEEPKGRREVIVNGTIWYRLKNGRRVDADFSSWIVFVDQGAGQYQAEFYEVYLDSYELTTEIKKMKEAEGATE